MPRFFHSSVDTTATVQISSEVQAKGNSWFSLIAHVERKLPNDTNHDIESQYTKFNEMRIDNRKHLYQDFKDEKLGKFIEEHDAKQKRKDRKYNDEKGYFSKNKRFNGHVDKNAVMWFGSKEIKDDFLKQIKMRPKFKDVPDQDIENMYRQAASRGLIKYAESFESRNSNIKVGCYGTNVDESGAPHIHMQLMPFGTTKRGEPSFSFNTALHEQYSDDFKKMEKFNKQQTDKSKKKPTNKILMRNFRAQEDAQIFKIVGHEISKAFDNEVDFRFIRKGVHGHDSMEKFKADKKLSEQRNSLNGEITLKSYDVEILDKNISNKQKTSKSLDNEIKSKQEISTRYELESKNQFMETIRVFEPSHKVPRRMLSSDDVEEIPEPIETDKGWNQHSIQPIKWLRDTAKAVMDKIKYRVKKEREEALKAEKRAKKASDSVAKRIESANAKIADNNAFYKRFVDRLTKDFSHVSGEPYFENYKYAIGSKERDGKGGLGLLAEMTLDASKSTIFNDRMQKQAEQTRNDLDSMADEYNNQGFTQLDAIDDLYNEDESEDEPNGPDLD